MPGFIRRIIWKHVVRSPFITKENMGIVILTSIDMMGKINGWVIPVSVFPDPIAVGSIIKKLGVKNGKIEIREYLYITASLYLND